MKTNFSVPMMKKGTGLEEQTEIISQVCEMFCYLI